MTKCAKCGTGWTSSGLPLCPICGTKVPVPVAAAPTRVADPIPLIEMPAAEAAVAARETSVAVLEPPPEPRKPEPPPELRRPKTEILPVPEPEPPPLMLKKEFLVDAEPRLRLVDPSAADIPVQRDLPSPTRPLIGPLVLGSMAFVPALLLPLTAVFEGTRVLGVLGFCMAGFFAPFAPIAWMVGLAAEQRRRDQGLRPERAVTLGRKLGQAATLALVGELTLLLIAVAALRLSGKFPGSFWAYF